MICCCSEGMLYERRPRGEQTKLKVRHEINQSQQNCFKNASTKVFVLRVRHSISIRALLHTFRGFFFALARRTSSIYVMFTGGNGVGSATCNTHIAAKFFGPQKMQCECGLNSPTLESYRPPVTRPVLVQNSQAAEG